MSELQQREAEAQAVMARLRDVLAQEGLRSVDAPRNPFGAGLGVAWGDDVFTVMTVEAGEPGMINLGSAVLRSVDESERAALLDQVNSATRDNPLMPVVLHDAEAGWDVIVMQRFPLQLLLRNPRFLHDCAHALAHTAKDFVERFGQFGGRRPQWTADDLHELVIRTTL